MHKLKKAKKGAIAAPLVDFYAYVLFAIVIVIFYIVFKVSAGAVKVDIKGDAGDLTVDTALIDFLNTPLEINGKKGTTSDFTRAVYYNNLDINLFKSEIEKILDSFIANSDYECYSYNFKKIKGGISDLYGRGPTHDTKKADICASEASDEVTKSNVFFPINKETRIEIELALGKGK